MEYAGFKKAAIFSNTVEIISSLFAIAKDNNIELLQSGDNFIVIHSEDIFDSLKIYCKTINHLIKKDTNIAFLDDDEEIGIQTFSKLLSLESVCNKLESLKLMEMIEKESFVTHFHQIFDLDKGELFGYETLLRGVYEGVNVPPFEIFSMAHRSDSLFVLDRIARATNLKFAAKYKIEKNLFINFIPTSIYDPAQCLKSTVALAKELGINPENIVFEVVETEKVDDVEHLKGILDYYKNQGFRVALDDVGSGYSNLNLIAKLKPNIIKVDREIIDHIDSDGVKQSIFEALVNISSKNNILVLAEGVERVEELDFVKNNGANLAQGYIYSKPTEVPLL